jgi:hypothetical protein
MGIAGTLAFVFINFTFIYTLQLLQTRQVAWGGYLQAIVMAGINIAIVMWFGRTLAKAGWGEYFKPRAVAPSSPKKPISNVSRDEARAAQARAKAALLAYSQTVSSFSIQDVMTVTGLERVGAEYVLDDLIMTGQLKAEHSEQGFIYRVTSDDADVLNKR